MTADSEDDLQESLTALAGALTGAQPLTVTLRHVASLAVSAVPGADGAGLTLLEQSGPDTIVASADFVEEVDAAQYGIGEGPCLLAVATRTTQWSGSLGGEEDRWPRFGPQAGRMGVHSALSVPLLLGERVVGALNIYAHGRDAFDQHSIAIGEEFSGPAAVTASHALLLEESRRMTAHLQKALTSRATIDQAIGIVLSRTGKTPHEAFEVLRRQSQQDHIKLSDVAAQVVEQALARARSGTRSRPRIPGPVIRGD
ncbi:GAF and ANTAR domain-containing protein [Kineosporia sp. NBRC 101731]|uniref:GAF and ANTAR domain-containing protein n=1 Tax=Kineosporia sp. NBRC 101731 TaxID=3032199 RepID=UPI0024A1F510|nr:GAF and ANTAR domain-containing protein [Kineosporia sp. NBRC 101731]GLY33233.1 transcriptional regulator [Kineosporia sp. NBRC 101731]